MQTPTPDRASVSGTQYLRPVRGPRAWGEICRIPRWVVPTLLLTRRLSPSHDPPPRDLDTHRSEGVTDVVDGWTDTAGDPGVETDRRVRDPSVVRTILYPFDSVSLPTTDRRDPPRTFN